MKSNNGGIKCIYVIFIMLIILAIGSGLYLFKDKIFGNDKTYDLYIDYLSKYNNNEIFDIDGKKIKVDTIYVRMIKVEGIKDPLMMVDAYDEDESRIFNMYYTDKDGNVNVEYFDDDTYYNAIYDYNNKDYKYYLLKRTSGDIGYYDHIISLADYINDKENKEEYDVINTDPRFIGFELDEKVKVNKNSKDALKKAIKNMKSLDKFYENEKEIIDDAHREYKAYHEDDEE